MSYRSSNPLVILCGLKLLPWFRLEQAFHLTIATIDKSLITEIVAGSVNFDVAWGVDIVWHWVSFIISHFWVDYHNNKKLCCYENPHKKRYFSPKFEWAKEYQQTWYRLLYNKISNDSTLWGWRTAAMTGLYGVENKHSNEHSLNISFEVLNEIKRVLKELNTILNKHPVMLNKPIGYKL